MELECILKGKKLDIEREVLHVLHMWKQNKNQSSMWIWSSRYQGLGGKGGGGGRLENRWPIRVISIKFLFDSTGVNRAPHNLLSILWATEEKLQGTTWCQGGGNGVSPDLISTYFTHRLKHHNVPQNFLQLLIRSLKFRFTQFSTIYIFRELLKITCAFIYLLPGRRVTVGYTNASFLHFYWMEPSLGVGECVLFSVSVV